MSKPHESAHNHVTGRAEYIDDRPFVRGEVLVDVFWSPVAHGKIKSLDLSQAQKVEGVAGLFTAKDLHLNQWGTIFHDQPFLAEDTVNFAGEAIVIIAAESKQALHEAKEKIKIEFEVLPAVLDLQEAIDNKDFIGPVRTIRTGDAEKSLDSSPHSLSGDIVIAGQDHFYLESQAAIAYPKEDGQIEVHSSTQHPTEVQHLVAEALGLKFHQVVCIVKRLGGGFGGKESQSGPFAVYASLVAKILNRPARLILTKDDDMIMTGKRNPFKNFYEVGFDENGKILALKAKLFSDSGAYADLSTAIMERAMLHLDNAYCIENFVVEGTVCKTNKVPSTAFRGFGGPKGVVTIESIIEDIAAYLDIDAMDVRKRNVYQKGELTPYDQIIDDDVLPQLFEKLEQQTNYSQWRKQVDLHNQNKNATLKGLAVTAVKFGISFTTRFLNQGNALVNIHLDGSIQVSTGAVEMGQGVNTKIAQVVADCFAINLDEVRVMSTSTEKNPNTSATAASSGSDINAQAALNASLSLKENLARTAIEVLKRSRELRGWAVAGAGTAEEINASAATDWKEICFEDSHVFHKKNPSEKVSFKELVQEAYLNRIPLTAQGFFRYPGIYFNKETGKGRPFFYYTNGLAASEVSIDRLTGELKVLKTEILMDLGRPLNKGIDEGQVRGAFIQGMGWVSTENIVYRDGLVTSNTPSTYKIPSIHDIPRDFNCTLIDNPLNEKNVKGSKAVGEPPLLLAVSVWAAVKNALRYSGKKNSTLKLPATQEEIFHQLHNDQLGSFQHV